MLSSLVLAVPMGITWVLVTGNPAFDNFLLGVVVGAAILLLVRTHGVSITWRKLPDQVVGLVIYVVTLLRDIWLATWDVTKRVLDPKLPMNPGILRVPTGDNGESEFIAAFSAHGITITPGELVVDFEEDVNCMYVHCLDIEASSRTAFDAQATRLRRLHRVIGKTQ